MNAILLCFCTVVIALCLSCVYSAYRAKAMEAQYSNIKIKVGETRSIKNITPKDSCSSNNHSVAYVDSSGVITGKKAGKATITVKCAGKKKRYIKVTVNSVKRKPNIAVCLNEVQCSKVYLTLKCIFKFQLARVNSSIIEITSAHIYLPYCL